MTMTVTQAAHALIVKAQKTSAGTELQFSSSDVVDDLSSRMPVEYEGEALEFWKHHD